MNRRPKAPAHLRQATGRWWRAVHEEYSLEAHHTRLLTLAAEAFDRCSQAREAIEADGITVKTADGGIKAHPAVAIERDSRLAFARLLRELVLRPRVRWDTSNGLLSRWRCLNGQ
jgi:P27 family predicted phage terminase small subunit